MTRLAIPAALALLAAPALADPADEVRAATEAYLGAWSYEDGIDWTAFQPLLMPDGFEGIDTFGGGVPHLDSYEDYVATWGPAVEGPPTESTGAEHGIDIRASEDLGVALFILRGEGVRADGSPNLLRRYATLVWVPGPDGDWRLLREHLTSIREGGPD